METRDTFEERKASIAYIEVKQRGLERHEGCDFEEIESSSSRSSFVAELCRLEDFLEKVRVSLTVFGLFYRQTDERTVARGKGAFNVSCKSSLLYNVIILVLMWANCLRYVLIFGVGNVDHRLDCLRVLTAVWSFQLCMNATIMFKASHPRLGNQARLCEFWKTNVMDELPDLDLDFSTAALRRKLALGLILGWTCISVNVIFVGVLLFLPSGLINDMLSTVLVSPLPDNVYTKTAVLVCHLFNTVAWILPMLYVSILATVLNNTLLLCCSALQKTIKDKPNQFPKNLRKIRMLHLNICKTVEIMDSDTKFLFANWYATNLPIVSVILYNLVQTSLETSTLCLNIFWLVTSIMATCFVSTFAATLHETARAPLVQLHVMSVQGATVEQLGQVRLFLSKLTNRSTGFTVMTLIVITKDLLLSVLGLYLTYFFILLQL